MSERNRRVLVTGLALVALATFATTMSAATKDYSVTVAPGSVPAGRLVDMTATIRNLTAQQQLGSANVSPPPGFAAVSVTSLSRPQPATIVGGVVQLRAVAPPAGQRDGRAEGQHTNLRRRLPELGRRRQQGNDFSGLPGNSLTLDASASSLTTTTTGACTPCPEDQQCTASLDGATGSHSTVTSDPDAAKPDVGLLTISQTGAHDRAGYAERSSDAFLMDAPQNRAKRALLTFSSATRPVTSRDPLEVPYVRRSWRASPG